MKQSVYPQLEEFNLGQAASQAVCLCGPSSGLFLCSDKNRATCHRQKPISIPNLLLPYLWSLSLCMTPDNYT